MGIRVEKARRGDGNGQGLGDARQQRRARAGGGRPGGAAGGETGEGGQPLRGLSWGTTQTLTWSSWHGGGQGPPPLPPVDPGAENHRDHVENIQAQVTCSRGTRHQWRPGCRAPGTGLPVPLLEPVGGGCVCAPCPVSVSGAPAPFPRFLDPPPLPAALDPNHPTVKALRPGRQWPPTQVPRVVSRSGPWRRGRRPAPLSSAAQVAATGGLAASEKAVGECGHPPPPRGARLGQACDPPGLRFMGGWGRRQPPVPCSFGRATGEWLPWGGSLGACASPSPWLLSLTALCALLVP